MFRDKYFICDTMRLANQKEGNKYDEIFKMQSLWQNRCHG